MILSHYLGAVMILILITVIGWRSGKRVKSAGDFSTGGRKAGAGIVAGSIIGTLVGGASTIGTAQLAFRYGFSAWWFTLGGGIACLVLALFFVKPLYQSGIRTLPQVFSREYGRTAATTSALLTSIGSFLSIVSQILSGIALITSVSRVGAVPAAVIVVLLMIAYVVFGGVWGAGMVGIVKTGLLYVAVGVCGFLALGPGGGWSAFRAALPAERYFDLFARGVSVDLGAGFSLVVGILTTQAYIQAVVSARSLKLSRAGVLASAALIPPIGVAGILVGMYMRLNHPGINPGMALPMFVLEKVPPFLAGMILATLLITLVGTGAGITLGLSSMICGDIYKVYINPSADDRRTLVLSRFVIVVILAAAGLFGGGNMGTMILGWSFLSMGLRGATAVGALCAALFLPGRIDRRFAVSSMIVGPVFVLFGKFALLPAVDPLFLGVGASAVVLLAGFLCGRRRTVRIPR